MPALDGEHLDISMLETWLWDAACAIRGATDAPKFKDFILPLIFFKRLSDVFDDEFTGQVKEFGHGWQLIGINWDKDLHSVEAAQPTVAGRRPNSVQTSRPQWVLMVMSEFYEHQLR